MAEIPENLEMNLSRKDSASARKKAKRWTVLFVDDRGKTVAFKRFKGLATLAAFLIVASVAVAAGSYVLYDRSEKERQHLENALAAAVHKAKALISEKEKLAARLVIAASRAGDALSGESTPSSEISVPASAASPEPITDPADAQPVVEQQAPDKPPEPAPAAPRQASEPIRVAVEGLKVFRKAGRNRMEVKFTLKNIDDGNASISGYSFVVLKDGGNDDSGWCVFPKVDMVLGKPASVKGGRYFQISRFKTITFDTQEKLTPESFKAATIIIYDESGELLLEKDFSLNEAS